MTRVLHFWKRIWQSVEFDTVAGQGRVRWFSRAPSRGAGWAMKHAGSWFALWSDGENLILQAGKLRVPMTGEYRASNVRVGTSRQFTVAKNDRVVFELTYKACDRDEDPSFDLADLEQEDFFFYVSRLWNDEKWKADVVKNWASATGDVQ